MSESEPYYSAAAARRMAPYVVLVIHEMSQRLISAVYHDVFYSRW